MLEDEAQKLTDIGNSFHIRHAEVAQIRITDSLVLDYLFHRLFSMIQLLILKQMRPPNNAIEPTGNSLGGFF